jgi:hypothetical protein
VQTGTSSAYTVTSSGSYTVQGKNAGCTGTTSSSKVVTINTVNLTTCCPGVLLYQTTSAYDGYGNRANADADCSGKGARLPSKDEMVCLCQIKAILPGGLNGDVYHTSTWAQEYISNFVVWTDDTNNCGYGGNTVASRNFYYRCVK